MFVKERFVLDGTTVDLIRSMVPDFGYDGFGEFLFYRTYSREICDLCKQGLLYDKKRKQDYCREHGFDFQYGQETWHDVVIRVISGTMSIRKDWYVRNHIAWDEGFWQHYARHMAVSMFRMEWFPPGRGLWAMGTDFIYERGSMALQNCGCTTIGEQIGADVNWMMDALMCGVGVGFIPIRDDDLQIYNPVGSYDFVIPDSREGWCEATERLIDCHLQPNLPKPRLIYDIIRSAGQPIRGFGGVSSGPEPLMRFHAEIEQFIEMFASHPWYNSVIFKTDIANAAGCCVVAGNVRRSAELCAGDIDDIIDLKDYAKYPHRQAHGWMSNNSVFLSKDEDFERLGEIAQRIIRNGEPGFINLRNLPFGRIGKSMEGLRWDPAISFNPCGEQPLLDKENCTLVESCPTKCSSVEDWYKACEYATLYASTVTLLPTHRPETNAVMLRNRRIGVGIVDVAGWQQDIGITRLTKYLRAGYKKVVATNQWTNSEAGVPLAIRHTTIKPGGTTPKLPGLRSGWQWPTFGLTLRRVRVARNWSGHRLLVEAGVPYESDVMSAGTDVFEWPVDQGDNGRVRPATLVSIWEQAMMLVLLQREWSDNAVSNTIYFRPRWNLVKDIDVGDDIYDPSDEVMREIETTLTIGSWDDFLQVQEVEAEGCYRVELVFDEVWNSWRFRVYDYDVNHEEDYVEPVLGSIAPLTKSAALLPHAVAGVYRQSPEEGIGKEEYDRRKLMIRKIDWSKLRHSDGIDEKFCSGPSCEVKFRE